ncbi:MAG: lipid-A-disaccharide synthase [Alphaproteobacteria bacterium GM7ARS4]|nr:lipid-A-disaccharide synthase [Alphaproteobacteria bacterium GM7ARS4]
MTRTGKKTYRFFIVAGEASGDILGAGLMAAMKEQRRDVRLVFEGVGGRHMCRQGLKPLFDMGLLSVMGYSQVLWRLPTLIACLRRCVVHVAHGQPDMVITVDSPSFAMRFVSRLKKNKETASIPCIHYVAPTVWAWKAGRAQDMARLYQGLLTLLPFEPPYFECYGLPTYFAGHPSVVGTEVIRCRRRDDKRIMRLCLCPGSRPSEVRHHLPLMLEAVSLLKRRCLAEGVTFETWIVMAQGVEARIRSMVEGRGEPSLIDRLWAREGAGKEEGFEGMDVALAVSGTVSLDLAVKGVAMVIIYKIDRLTAWIVKRCVRVRYATLVNLMAESMLIPELLFDACTAVKMAETLYPLMMEKDAREQQQKAVAPFLRQLRCQDGHHPFTTAATQLWRWLAHQPSPKAL